MPEFHMWPYEANRCYSLPFPRPELRGGPYMTLLGIWSDAFLWLNTGKANFFLVSWSHNHSSSGDLLRWEEEKKKSPNWNEPRSQIGSPWFWNQFSSKGIRPCVQAIIKNNILWSTWLIIRIGALSIRQTTTSLFLKKCVFFNRSYSLIVQIIHTHTCTVLYNEKLPFCSSA